MAKQLLVYVALGANLPSDLGSLRHTPAHTLPMALASLGALGLHLHATSRFYATPCFPAGAGPDYVNAAAALTADPDLSPADILARLHQVEAAYGRTRSTRWAGRSLDLDLLAIGDAVLPDAKTHRHWCDLPLADQARLAPDQLILPHPRIADRAFVLVPLCDIAPDWHHPVTGHSVRTMRDALPASDLAAVRPLPEEASDLAPIRRPTPLLP
ncbi:2-amino-4-hydroxy-6-hydroxymethyldihydropteridinediphosphokinase [Pseudorhodobacter antarcticus]|uniref:2-amino-4-hydroxy-6-hydroxymethyldihydropteridine pyrophosphokinase n=2 Tax=Pseudorhodobacter antarcticus TaxID=1077947 RepID=A0A1H8IYV5_9RHOB|nr:2-amino-4-hydroxy-6-hydroxymethyldihydropteridine diphosphokinase [Pseudorhodobacter antarcticus]SEN73774.1 2-amino-4-hydroxy-6-hydroxymethyldihydropteridinediphosphokinase [Pseudorhodobacter antarcticus]